MTEIELTSDLRCDLVAASASDAAVIQAMLVSTLGEHNSDVDNKQLDGRIAFLMKNRHGTPFEHTFFKFFIAAPIFVFREFHRHRIGWSYNEMSGRYTQLPARFYVPPPERPLVQVGKPGHYEYVPGTDQQLGITTAGLGAAYRQAYETYETLLAAGVAKEIARACLPVATYSEMYATCNARSLMAFLSLRTKRDDSTFPSYPMWEIEQVANKMEYGLRDCMPSTWRAFNENGRVSP